MMGMLPFVATSCAATLDPQAPRSASPEFGVVCRGESPGSLRVAGRAEGDEPGEVKIPDKPARDIGFERDVHAGFPGTHVEGIVAMKKRQNGSPVSSLVKSIVKPALTFAALAASSGMAHAAGGADVSPAIYQLMVFVIAICVGYFVVWSVTPALHTPLMAVTNAISSVIVVGALLAVGVPLVSYGSGLSKFFGFLALVMASVNIFGGFLVTQRMLAMYKKKEKK